MAPAAAEPDPDRPTVGEEREARQRVSVAASEVEIVQAELTAANAELETAVIRAAKAAEAWNGARWTASQAAAAERDALAASADADRALEVQRTDYRDALLTAHSAGLDLASLAAVASSDGLASMIENSAAGERVRELFDQRGEEYDAAATTAENAARAATTASDKAERALATARTARDTARAQARAATATATRVARRRTVLVREVARLQGVSIRVAQRRQDALEAEQNAQPLPEAQPQPEAQARHDAQPGPDPEPAPEPEPAPNPEPAPAPDGGARAAIAYARAQLGEPYRWGAAGPSAWDCSGLTSKAWAAGGEALPHYSVAQYDATTPISAAQLRPGDLVFWADGSDPSAIFHVALYVGDGRIIHAPRTGRPVTEESIHYWRTPDFYGRP